MAASAMDTAAGVSLACGNPGVAVRMGEDALTLFKEVRLYWHCDLLIKEPSTMPPRLLWRGRGNALAGTRPTQGCKGSNCMMCMMLIWFDEL